MTSSLKELSNFSIDLTGNHNQQINFESDEPKINILNFKIDFSKKLIES